ncbi:MAG: hypothetical protein JXR64_10410 [Spirochaetales bacterium]|nr:hypothetical protein [Spirochaetales bacterium]
MKKTALLLAFSLVLSTLVTAADVTVGGWFETHGKVRTMSGDAATDDEKDTRIMHGTNEFSVNVNVNGEGFGATAHLGGWSGEAMGIASVDGVNSGHIWAEMLPGLKVSAGIGIETLDYAPTAASTYWNDQFGLGIGKYNYMGYGPYTGGVTGLTAEYTMDALSAALVVKNDFTGGDWSFTGLEKFEDATKNMFNVNVKYALDVATIYAGFSQKTVTDANGDDEAQPAIWVAASTSVVEGLILDLKYEGIFAADAVNSPTVISANLGYNLGMVNIKTTEEITLVDGDMGWAADATITPALPVALGLDIKAGFKQANPDADMLYKVGGVVSKGYGNVGASLGVDYELVAEDKTQLTVDAKMSIWF